MSFSLKLGVIDSNSALVDHTEFDLRSSTYSIVLLFFCKGYRAAGMIYVQNTLCKGPWDTKKDPATHNL